MSARRAEAKSNKAVLASSSIALVGVVAATLLTLSGGWFWLGDLASNFRFYIGVASALTTVCLALMCSRWALLGAAIALWHLGPVARLYVPVAVPSEASARLKLVAANLHWHNRSSTAFFEWIARETPDVLLLMEISPFWRDAISTLEEEYPHRIVELQQPDDVWRRDSFAIGLFSKVPWDRVEIHRLVGGSNKMLEVHLVVPGASSLLLRAVHAPHGGWAPHARFRDQHYAEMVALDWSEDTVLVGDLNCTTYARSLGSLMSKAGLRDSRLGFGRLPSWGPWKRVAGSLIAIDHVLVGQGVHVMERYNEPIAGSDHMAVVAILGW